METFAKDTLDQAVNIAAGVNSETTGTARNEQNIYVRGFDRWQVPLTVDGVRVYLPVDNRLDFARFQTPDIAEVQISKGYVSVLDGPDGMGGLINLVSRKPVREIESELCVGSNLAETAHMKACNPPPISARSSRIITRRSAAHGAT